MTLTITPSLSSPHRGDLQSNILHLLSPLTKLTPPLVIYPDYTIETPIGFFRIAYSKETHTSALFYSRHADNLSGAENDIHEIGHKDYVYLIAMREHHHHPSAKWDVNDNRRQIDMSWATAKIYEILNALPRTLLREATLHKVSDSYVSTFAAYSPYIDSEKNELNISLTTKAGEKYHFIDKRHKPPQIGPVGWMAKRLSADFNLSARDEPGSKIKNYAFRENDVVEAILADFHARLLLIWKGVDPVKWREVPVAPMLPFARMTDVAFAKARETAEEARRDPEEIIRKILENGVHFLTGGLHVWLETVVIRNTSELGHREKMGITPEWKAIGDHHIKRFPTITSNLHTLLMQPHPDKFKDLKWLTPDHHALSFESSAVHAIPTRERLFSVWVHSQLTAPYASLFQYLGENGPATPEDTKLILTSSSSGVQVYYVPGQHEIYAYYNVPDNKIAERKLNYDADDFFDPGCVLKLKLGDPSQAIERIGFEEFKKLIKAKTGLENIPFPKSQEPPETLLNPEPVKPLLADIQPK